MHENPSCHLSSDGGNPLYAITLAEGQSLVRQGKAKRTGKTTFELISNPQPSESKDSSTALVEWDMQVLVGAAPMNHRMRERLIGYGLIRNRNGRLR
jgi:hypothetical protein